MPWGTLDFFLMVALAITCASAALPAKRPPTRPWDAEPPTAEAARHLRDEMLPHDDGEPMSEEVVAASAERSSMHE